MQLFETRINQTECEDYTLEIMVKDMVLNKMRACIPLWCYWRDTFLLQGELAELDKLREDIKSQLQTRDHHENFSDEDL